MKPALLALAASVAVVASAPMAARQAVTIQTIELGTPGGGTAWASAQPDAINARGDVALTYSRTTGGGREVSAFLWNRATGYTLIADNAYALDVNDNGQVVGEFYPCADGCEPRGFLWSASRGFIDLGATLPSAINNAGRMGISWAAR
jgi:probable HAF family extracellular repeat protein